MADQTVPVLPTVLPTESGFPPPYLPILFADGVVQIAPSHQAVKFYLYRTDPDTAGLNAYKNQVFAQIVMPTVAFVQTCLFFERTLKQMVAANFVPQAQVDAMNAMFDAGEAAQAAQTAAQVAQERS